MVFVGFGNVCGFGVVAQLPLFFRRYHLSFMFSIVALSRCRLFRLSQARRDIAGKGRSKCLRFPLSWDAVVSLVCVPRTVAWPAAKSVVVEQ